MMPSPPQRGSRFEDLAKLDPARQKAADFAGRHKVAIGVAVIHGLEHVE
jgi:hypothetical protein